MTQKKVVLKVISDIDDSMGWEHLCYIEKTLFYKFLDILQISSQELSDYLCKWIKADFQIDLTMTHQNDIYIFKELVKKRYATLQPDLYMDTNTDRQGWLRVYISEKMRLELRRLGAM